MSSPEEIHNALLAINARLNTIDGKVTLVARADREQILAVLEAAVRKNPLIARIYLLLDGKRTQRDIRDALSADGLSVHEATISRRIDDMIEEGVVEINLAAKRGNVYRKNKEMESVLSLSKWMTKWLAAIEKEQGQG